MANHKAVFTVTCAAEFGFWNFGHWDLPFGFAQGGEPVEPFGLCNLVPGILSSLLNSEMFKQIVVGLFLFRPPTSAFGFFGVQRNL